jgi:branched-chain amino acid transport system permease protein
MSVARPCGVYNEKYEQEFIIVRTRTQWAFLAIALIFLFTMPLYASGFVLHITNYIGITLIAVLGLHILMGYCGQMSIGQSAFVGIGAYSTAILMNQLGFSFWLAMPCAMIITGIVGILVGLPSLRVKGFYLVMATLAAQIIVPWLIGHVWVSATGGSMGITVPAATIGDMTLSSQTDMLYLIWPLVIFGIFVSVNLMRSKTGRAFIAIRDNDLAAEVTGINLVHYKLLAFFICSLYAGLAGALCAVWARALSVDQFGFSNSVIWLAMVIVGGLGSNAGACMGAIALILTDELTKAAAPLIGAALALPTQTMGAAIGPVVFGLIVILFLIFEPRGLAHVWERFKHSYRLNPYSY